MQRVAIPLVSADLLYQVATVWYCWGTKQQSNKATKPALPLGFEIEEAAIISSQMVSHAVSTTN
jgi:hypothetical protein